MSQCPLRTVRVPLPGAGLLLIVVSGGSAGSGLSHGAAELVDPGQDGLGEGERVEVPEAAAKEVHQHLINIRADIQALGYRVTPIDEWWVRAAAEDDSGR